MPSPQPLEMCNFLALIANNIGCFFASTTTEIHIINHIVSSTSLFSACPALTAIPASFFTSRCSDGPASGMGQNMCH